MTGEASSQLVCPRCYRPVLEEDLSCAGCGAKDLDWITDPAIGRIIGGKYRIDARLGFGGMGTVFLATHCYGATDFGRVVIKFLLAEFVEDADRRERFVREARAARELRSPHVIKVFDFGEDQDGAPYLVMEFIEGQSLFDVMVQELRLPVARALRIGLQIAEAMAECHEKGVLHRDLKPDNLLLLKSRAGDFVKIVDFGIARVLPAQGGGASAMVASLIIGTPRYMAPEQLMGLPIDQRIDIYSLGVILFEMMCGRPPIKLKTGDNEMAYVALNVSEPPTLVSEVLPGAPAELDQVVNRMMAKDPRNRTSSMVDVMQALEGLLMRFEHEASSAAGIDREARSAAGIDREARSAAVIDREARSAAVIDREARSAAVIDREARSAAVIDREARSAAGIAEDESLRGAPDRPGTGDGRPLTVPNSSERVTLPGQRSRPTGADRRSLGLVIAAALLGIVLGLITVGLVWVRHW